MLFGHDLQQNEVHKGFVMNSFCSLSHVLQRDRNLK